MRGWLRANPAGTVENFRLDTLTSDRTLRLHIDNSRLLGFYQSDDVFRYSDHVMGYEPKRARILSGSWATTIMTAKGRTDAGHLNIFAPCMNLPNTLSDVLTGIAAGGGALAGAAVGTVFPGIGNAVGAGVGALTLGGLTAVVSNSDIVMSTQSKVRVSRGVMSHEYGHYLFCNLVNEANSDAVDHIVWGTMILSPFSDDELALPLRYTNEAVAEFFEGQVASGADYGWLGQAESTPTDQYCSNLQKPCWDDNLDGAATGRNQATIGRVATLLHDVFDGQPSQPEPNIATDADAWHWDATTSRLVFSPAGGGDDDFALERVALPAKAFQQIATFLAHGMEPFVAYDFEDGNFDAGGFAIDDMKIRQSVDFAMQSLNTSWCDRCRVLALHEAGANKASVRGLWESCLNDPELQSVLGPGPDPTDLRLDYGTCLPCSDSMVSDEKGECQPCIHTVVGNDCVICTTDIFFDGNTLPFDTHLFDLNPPIAGDLCPNELSIQVQNAGGIFARGADFFTAGPGPSPLTEPNCERDYSMTTTILQATGSPVSEDALASVGGWPDCTSGQTCLSVCNDLPVRSITPSEASFGTVRFRVPAQPNAKFEISVGSDIIVE